MVNYIRHLEKISERFYEDTRLSPWHVSLYYGLFHSWNRSKFQNPISICRSELMTVSKIGSVNTYTKCLKQLDEWGYIEYIPSHNPMKGSLVNLYIFDTTIDNSNDTTDNMTTDTTAVTLVRPSINSLNNRNNKTSKTRKKKTTFSPPPIDKVKEFFNENNSSIEQAEKFFNHFESNGWLVGGKAKMKNWQAAARNWTRRSEEFATRSLSSSKGASGNLNVNQNKDYSIPL